MKFHAWIGSLLTLLPFGFAPFNGRGATHDVDIIRYSFSPSSLTVSRGDAVRWTQRDAFTYHTSTSGQNGVGDGVLDSSYLGQTETFSFTFNNAGNYPYFCQLHTYMIGSVTVQGAADSPPSISITNPVGGASFTTTNTITIEADASDSDGVVEWVEFFDGTNSLGIDVTAPFSIQVNLSPGSHSLAAAATDDQGASSTSAAVTVNVSTVPIPNPIPEKIAKGSITIELQTFAAGVGSTVKAWQA